MPTAILRVNEPLAGTQGYPVTLHVWEGDGTWPGQTDAPTLRKEGEGTIAPDLQAPGLPEALAASSSERGKAIRGALVAQNGPPSADINALGEWLHALLDEAGIGKKLQALRREHSLDAEPGQGLPMLLDLRAAGVRHLPWELLYDGEDRRWPFGELPNPAARITASYGKTDEKRDWWWPLKFLVVIGAKAADDPFIAAEKELQELEDALADLCAEIDVEVLRRPTRQQLRDELQRRPPHILHFIGHGDCDEKDGEGRLVFQLEKGDSPAKLWHWRADEIGADLVRSPRVAVLNCCRTDGEEAPEGSWQVADAFAARGVPAVVSMQGPISGPDAVAFAKSFYAAVARGATFDVAVTHGRRAITAKVGWKRREMCFPTLTLNQPPQNILPPRWIPGAEIRGRIEELEAGTHPKLLDRRPLRRQLLDQLDMDSHEGSNAATPVRLLGITGEEAIGKSALVKWAIARQAQRGRQALYVSLGGTPCGWLQLLRKTCKVAQGAVVDCTPFDRFARDVNYLVQSRDPPDTDPGKAVVDEQQPFEGGTREIELIFNSFLRALRRTAARGPLIIAIDSLTHVSPEDIEDHVGPKLLSRVAARDALDTRLVLVRRGQELDLPQVSSMPRTIHVEPFDTDQAAMRMLARQYLLLTLPDPRSVDRAMKEVSPLRTGTPRKVLAYLHALVDAVDLEPAA